MNAHDEHDWRPDPQLLAAYFDGELEGRDDGAALRARLEAWLEQHPEARSRWAEHHAFRRFWLETTPLEPGEATWNRVLDQIDAQGRCAAAAKGRSHRRALGVIAASLALLLGLAYGAVRHAAAPSAKNDVIAQAPRDDDEEVLQVATAGEVVVTYIEGADARAIAVGQLPVQGPLELADVGDVHIVAVRSEAAPRLLPQVQYGPNRPMIWMPLETD